MNSEANTDIENFIVISGDIDGLEGTGAKTITLDPSKYGDLALGESENIEIEYDLIDDLGAAFEQTAFITVFGENDTPVLGVPAPQLSMSETDPSGVAGGNVAFNLIDEVAVNDVDDTDVHELRNVRVDGQVDGYVTVDQTTGEILVDDRSYQYLRFGQQAVFEVSFDVHDGVDSVAAIATVTINGRNDAPTPGVAVNDVYTENEGVQTIDLTASFADLDDSDTHTYTLDGVNAFSATAF